MSVEEELKSYILVKFRSLRAFANEIGMPYTTISSIFTRGFDKAGISNMIQICSFLNLDLEELHNGKIAKKIRLVDLKVNATELMHIDKYRALDDRGKANVDNLLETEYQFSLKQNLKEEQGIIYNPTTIAAHSEGKLTKAHKEDIEMAKELMQKKLRANKGV